MEDDKIIFDYLYTNIVGLAKFAGKGEIFMKKIENRIVIAPELEDINEILVWLKEEKENNINQYGFYNNKDIICRLTTFKIII